MSTRSSISISTAIVAEETAWMARALELACLGTALAHPNPLVGAVIVQGRRVVGEGFHVYDKRDHAEVVALKQAGEKARGAALYVTLEPCCTTGRTGPCTKAIIAAGITRVIAAMKDPNPKVAGRGFAELRRAGIQVDVRIGEDEARRTNEDFAKWIQTGLPFVTLKSALTLDGQIAERPGRSTLITGPAAHDASHQLRHSADAVITGVGTILADDPLFTDRTGEPRRRKLLRVVLDSQLRLPPRSKFVKSAEDDVLVFTTLRPESPKVRALAKAGVQILRVPAKNGHVDLHAVLAELGKRQMLNIVLEAGAELNGAALKADIVDKMVLFYAPKIMGTGGVPMAAISSSWFSKSPTLRNISVKWYEPDFAVEGYFHDVYRNHRSRRKS
jgi:diaminohydroxyphosphoribosylaminopyrimidine deaminase / 5-amino-6-(5-phosphoribosylamino)uracil reductase